MVRAILGGCKTQTRRVVKPVGNDEGFVIVDQGAGAWAYRSNDETPHASPYGNAGDRLWVRETFLTLHGRTFYRATHNGAADEDKAHGIIWKPSIHMPRCKSRITLLVTGMRVERLQDISEKDAIAEGAPWAACGSPQVGSHKAGFAQLWESINGTGSWEANPWVWVIEFEVMK